MHPPVNGVFIPQWTPSRAASSTRGTKAVSDFRSQVSSSHAGFKQKHAKSAEDTSNLDHGLDGPVRIDCFRVQFSARLRALRDLLLNGSSFSFGPAATAARRGRTSR